MTKKQRKAPQSPPPDRFRTITTEAVIKSLDCTAAKHTIVFINMKLSTPQIEDLSDLIEAQAEVRVQIATVVNRGLKQIEFETVVKDCKINATCHAPHFTPFKVSSDQTAIINDLIQAEEVVCVKIIQKSATLFPAGEEDADKD